MRKVAVLKSKTQEIKAHLTESGKNKETGSGSMVGPNTACPPDLNRGGNKGKALIHPQIDPIRGGGVMVNHRERRAVRGVGWMMTWWMRCRKAAQSVTLAANFLSFFDDCRKHSVLELQRSWEQGFPLRDERDHERALAIYWYFIGAEDKRRHGRRHVQEIMEEKVDPVASEWLLKRRVGPVE